MPWSWLLNKWTLGVLAVAGMGVALWIQGVRLTAAVAGRRAAEQTAVQWRQNFDTAAKTAEINAQAVAQLKAETARIAAAADAARADAGRLQSEYQALRRSIAHGTPTEDGAVAPVLQRVVDGLRRLEADDAGAAGDRPH